MEIRDENRNRNQKRRGSQSCLPEKFGQFYYTLGVICSSYPVSVLTFSTLVIISCCYPLINLPIPGNTQQQLHNLSSTSNFNKPTLCYIQQILLRSIVHPWNPNLKLGDAFRAPLYEIFRILEIIQNYQHSKSGKNLMHLCYRVDVAKKNYGAFFPQFSCLVLSPANLWQQDMYKFNQDANFLSTILKQENLQRGRVSIAEMVFGMNLKYTGIKRYPIRNRQRVIQYAITLFFKQYDKTFVRGLQKRLQETYSLNKEFENAIRYNHSESLFIYYPDELNYIELILLILTFSILFLYIYFSFRKIDLIRSKFAMAFAAVFSIFSSLFMSLGICSFFGLTLSSQSKDFFPYLVIIVGLENILILTKSVVSVPQHLDSKIRLAQGLSKEGWSITKNFLIELTILTIGLLTFIPIIQEFCIFTIVGMICDFFLQLFFYSTILSIDIKYQKDVSDLNRRDTFFFVQNAATSNRTKYVTSKKTTKQVKKLPKRLRLVHIWARTRFCQRAFMIWMIVWISVIIFRNTPEVIVPKKSTSQKVNWVPVNSSRLAFTPINYVTDKLPVSGIVEENLTRTLEIKKRLRYPEFQNWHYLSVKHWPAILSTYNLTTHGKYVIILPNIRLSHIISPEQALLIQNNDERYFNKFRWDTLAAALDPLDFIDRDIDHESRLKYRSQFEQPYYPNSPIEIFLVAILCIISVLVLSYALVVLYRCICSRNYAEWRASWNVDKTDESETQFIIEAVPTILKGHNQEIEFILTNESVIISTCLLGQVKIWDGYSGDLLCDIDRQRFFSSKNIESSPNTSKNSAETLSETEKDETLLLGRTNCDLKIIIKNGYREKSPNDSESISCDLSDDFDLGNIPAIWSIDCSDSLLVMGCSSGRIEIWNIKTGCLELIHEDEYNIGITSIKIINGTRIIAAKLIGFLELFQLEYTPKLNLICNKTKTTRAHHQPITCMECQSNRIVTGSKDHTLRVFRLDSCGLLYTLHGHCGPISCLFIDRYSSMTCGSASQDGLLCVWDLITGTCIFSVQAHDGNITALTYSSSYVISLGIDERLCVWDRFQGHLLNTISLNDCYTSSILMMSHHLIMTARYGSLMILDARNGETTRLITLGNRDNSVFVKQLHLLQDGIVCDYGMELRIIRFPLICHKQD